MKRMLAVAASFAMVASALTVGAAAATAAVPAHRGGAAHGTSTSLSGGVPHTITYDKYSMKVDGKRVYIWSGEFAPFRLPSPSLWRDVLQKMKAAGFNAVSVYFSWAYHSSAPGVYDFSGVRDVDKLLDIADQVGIYVIARPGPYINAEVDGGGFPAWLGTEPGHDRSTDPTYLKYAEQWLGQIDRILARHQLTNGTGPVIMYQVENEFYDGSPSGRSYMQALEKKARADGITVPFSGNHNGVFAQGTGAVQIPGQDSYPQGFNCSNPTHWNGVGTIPRLSDDSPIYTAEFQGGAFDPWGGPGYAKCRQLVNDDFANVFYKNNIADGATMQNFYMLYGGTNWGYQAEPTVYSSYDYGAAITEGRQLTPKYQEDKLIGSFTQSVAPLRKTDAIAVQHPSNAAITDQARLNPDTRTQFQVLRHSDSTSTADDDTHIAIDLGASATYTYDDADTTDLHYSSGWTHVGSDQSYTHGEYKETESFSDTAGDSVTIPFTGSAIRWISSDAQNHGIADVYLDGEKIASVDSYAASEADQQVQYAVSGLKDAAHTLKIVVTGTKNAKSQGTFVSIDAITLPTGTARVYPTVPQKKGTSIALNGRESTIIVADYKLGDSQLQYSTSQLMTNQTIDGRDIAVLYGDSGTDGETVLNYAKKPTVKVLGGGDVDTTWDATTGDLRLDYTHTGLQRVLVTEAGSRPLLLLLGTTTQAEKFWVASTSAGPVLVYGSDLVRSASLSHGSLTLTGDSDAEQSIEVFGPDAHRLTWNGRSLRTSRTASGSLEATIGGPRQVHLPALTTWKHEQGSPEAEPGFDDSSWQVADKMTTNSTTTPVTLPVLFQDDYGFHYGDVWYRGHVDSPTGATGITLSAITGAAGNYEAWLNGTYLGHSDDATHTFSFPKGALKQNGDNEISVLVDTSGHNEDWTEGDTNKEARGLTGATLDGAPLSTVTWRIQGTAGGEKGLDTVRGPMNTGGLYGERAGWSLPGYPDHRWKDVTLPIKDTTPGVSWYRTTARLDLPRGQDTSVGLKITDDPSRAYRTLIYVNGWQLGKYVNDVGPQTVFPIPAGILKSNGKNTIAIAVTNEDGTTGGLGAVSLVDLGTHASSLRVEDVASPSYNAHTYAQPTPHRATLTLATPGAISAGAATTVTATLTPKKGAGELTDARLGLKVPTGWTAQATTPTRTHHLRSGQSFSASWKVTAPAKLSAVSTLSATADYRQAGAGGRGGHGHGHGHSHGDRGLQHLTDVRQVRELPQAPTGDVQVSSMPFLSASNGWGPVERDMSNGEAAAGDGHTITIDGTQFAHGLGTNSPSDVQLYLGGKCTRFQATVGVDDEENGAGTVTFSVAADGTTLTTTPVMHGHEAGVTLDEDVSGAQVLDLVVGEGGDGNGNDHADWADARLTCS